MKKILTLVALFAGLSVYGQSFQVLSWSTNYAGGLIYVTNSILKTNAQVSEITVANPVANAVNLTFELFDAALDTNQWTRAGYTNRVGYQTNLTDSNVFYMGTVAYMTNIITNTGWRWVNKTVATAVVKYPAVFSIVVPAGETVTVPVDLTFTRGITYTATTNVIAAVRYRQTF